MKQICLNYKQTKKEEAMENIEGEKGIASVEVTLTENTGSEKVYTAKTDENGNFTITGFIPGDYTLTYTWGDETYTSSKL